MISITKTDELWLLFLEEVKECSEFKRDNYNRLNELTTEIDVCSFNYLQLAEYLIADNICLVLFLNQIENKITKSSAEQFVLKLIESIIIKISELKPVWKYNNNKPKLLDNYLNNRFITTQLKRFVSLISNQKQFRDKLYNLISNYTAENKIKPTKTKTFYFIDLYVELGQYDLIRQFETSKKNWYRYKVIKAYLYSKNIRLIDRALKMLAQPLNKPILKYRTVQQLIGQAIIYKLENQK